MSLTRCFETTKQARKNTDFVKTTKIAKIVSKCNNHDNNSTSPQLQHGTKFNQHCLHLAFMPAEACRIFVSSAVHVSTNVPELQQNFFNAIFCNKQRQA